MPDSHEQTIDGKTDSISEVKVIVERIQNVSVIHDDSNFSAAGFFVSFSDLIKGRLEKDITYSTSYNSNNFDHDLNVEVQAQSVKGKLVIRAGLLGTDVFKGKKPAPKFFAKDAELPKLSCHLVRSGQKSIKK